MMILARGIEAGWPRRAAARFTRARCGATARALRHRVIACMEAAEIAALPADMQAWFLRLAERIASAGLESLSEPHVKHLEGKLWELRLTGRDGIARALYVTAIGRRVIVVRAFVKKTQKTPPAEIKLALQRAKEIT